MRQTILLQSYINMLLITDNVESFRMSIHKQYIHYIIYINSKYNNNTVRPLFHLYYPRWLGGVDLRSKTRYNRGPRIIQLWLQFVRMLIYTYINSDSSLIQVDSSVSKIFSSVSLKQYSQDTPLIVIDGKKYLTKIKRFQIFTELLYNIIIL